MQYYIEYTKYNYYNNTWYINYCNIDSILSILLNT